MVIEFAGFWVVMAILMFVLIGLIAISLMLFAYVKFMQYKWNKQDKDLIDFGDVEYPDKFASFLHIPSFKEILDVLEKNNMTILEEVFKKDITTKENLERENIGDFIYYVAKRG